MFVPVLVNICFLFLTLLLNEIKHVTVLINRYAELPILFQFYVSPLSSLRTFIPNFSPELLSVQCLVVTAQRQLMVRQRCPVS
jgi:hypothetical protein